MPWKLVPTQPTPEMVNASIRSLKEHLNSIPYQDRVLRYGAPDENGFFVDNATKHTIRLRAAIEAAPNPKPNPKVAVLAGLWEKIDWALACADSGSPRLLEARAELAEAVDELVTLNVGLHALLEEMEKERIEWAKSVDEALELAFIAGREEANERGTGEAGNRQHP